MEAFRSLSQKLSHRVRLSRVPTRKFAVYKSPVKVDFYYDTISPYSWIAFEILQRYKPLWNLEIDYKPVVMGGILKATDAKPLMGKGAVSSKSKYIFQDIQRVAKFAKVPLRVPESPLYMMLVVGSLRQQRYLTAVRMRHPECVEDLSRNLWYRGWAEDMDIAKDVSLALVGRRAGLGEDEAVDCLEAMETEEVKSLLKETTDEAVREGAYGLPYLVVHKRRNEGVETFFGSDRFELMANVLGLEYKGPVPDPESFVPLEEATNPNEGIYMNLEDFDKLNKAFVEEAERTRRPVDPKDLL